MDAFSIVIVMLVFLLAGGVKGVVGLGLPTVAVAILSATFGIEAALPTLVIPSFVTNVWQGAIGGRATALFRRFGIALAIIPVATWIGYHYVFIAAPEAMERVLGVVLILYAGAGLAAVRLSVPPRTEPVLTPILGLANGLVTGVTGTFAVPMVMYLEALGLDRDELVQMLGIAFSVSTAALAVVLIAHGAYRLDAGYVSAVAVAPASPPPPFDGGCSSPSPSSASSSSSSGDDARLAVQPGPSESGVESTASGPRTDGR